MRHPFDGINEPERSSRRSWLGGFAAALLGLVAGRTAQGAAPPARKESLADANPEPGPRPSTKALGEEGGQKPTQRKGEDGGRPSTKALGEEGGVRPPVQITTLALGEEGGAGQPQATTFAVGEEG
ncbi:MAG: hypothetical protein U0840_07970 [Gemmataceae bacterium]